MKVNNNPRLYFTNGLTCEEVQWLNIGKALLDKKADEIYRSGQTMEDARKLATLLGIKVTELDPNERIHMNYKGFSKDFTPSEYLSSLAYDIARNRAKCELYDELVDKEILQ